MPSPQLGQADGGLARFSPRGSLQITTLRKEPMIAPNMAAIAAPAAVLTTAGLRRSAQHPCEGSVAGSWEKFLPTHST